MDNFMQKNSADEQVFQKIVDLSNAVENIISHYTAEHTGSLDSGLEGFGTTCNDQQLHLV